MYQPVKQMRFFFSAFQTTKDQWQTPYQKGFLNMFETQLLTGREKKSGTLRKITSYLLYSISLSPPPIRPMVENNRFTARPAKNMKVKNLIEEAA